MSVRVIICFANDRSGAKEDIRWWRRWRKVGSADKGQEETLRPFLSYRHPRVAWAAAVTLASVPPSSFIH
jgi:hypothetical protein